MIVVNKFINNIVVVRDTENEITFNLPATLVSSTAKEGDILIFDNQAGYYIVYNQKAVKTE